MRLRTVLGAISLAVCYTHAASNNTAPPFQIKDLNIRNHASTNITIEFTVHDVGALSKDTAVCSGSWEAKTDGYPQGSYAPCGDSTFSWHMESYQGIKSFVLGIEHVFEDPAVGEPPYDQMTNFGQGSVAEPAIDCKATSGVHFCAQNKGDVIKAPITESMAKRR